MENLKFTAEMPSVRGVVPGTFPGMLYRPATPADEAALADFFAALATAGDERLFHPHPLTHEAARTICQYHGMTDGRACDEYHLAIDDADARSSNGQILGYGILRGWAEGYAIPSLGIAVHPQHRGRGIARRMMAHLHEVAARRGAERVRLKVYRDNTPAIRLYESLGYEFEQHSETELLGFFTLPHPVAA